MADYSLIWSWKNRLEIIKNSVYTAHFYIPPEIQFILVDGGSTRENRKELRKFCDLLDRDIVFVEGNGNTLWRAWNIGLDVAKTRYCVFASSDVVFNRSGLITALDESLLDGYKYCLVDNHAVFMMDRAIIPKVGLFDENFINGPHADCDYLIRVTEAGVPWRCIHNSFYKHEDTPQETIQRTTFSVVDRLPMNTFENENYFRSKWKTDWPGWKDYVNQVHKPHPPISISQVTRIVDEVNWNPSLTHRMKELYGN